MLRLICIGLVLSAVRAGAQQSAYYAPQTFKQMSAASLFRPAYEPFDTAVRNQKIVRKSELLGVAQGAVLVAGMLTI
ncbi:unnamed protein product, partial [Iphiclides podalirius]